MNLDLVIFDMDGVIFDSEKVYFEANQIAADKLGMDYSLAYYKQFIGAGTEVMREQMIEDMVAVLNSLMTFCVLVKKMFIL